MLGQRAIGHLRNAFPGKCRLVLFSGSSPDLLGDILEVSSGIQGMRNRLQNGYMHSNRRLFNLLVTKEFILINNNNNKRSRFVLDKSLERS
jgi:hypothetical protein